MIREPNENSAQHQIIMEQKDEIDDFHYSHYCPGCTCFNCITFHSQKVKDSITFHQGFVFLGM